MRTSIITVLFTSLALAACGDGKNARDASGTFEATETIVSAEASGRILELTLTEGDVLVQGVRVGCIDSVQLYLSRLQLVQNRKAILSGRPDVKLQIESLQRELENAMRDRDRIENLVRGNVASQKQLDDAKMRISVLQSRIAAQRSTLNNTTSTLNEQSNTVEIQLGQVEDQLRKCMIINPVSGTVLTKYSNANEFATVGKPLYKIADLSSLILRVYISGTQLPQVKLGQKVKVFTDDGKGGSKETGGTITWISDKAEFTPKGILTRDERAALVYALKIAVPNDGFLKIGMYGEVKLAE